MSDDERRLCAVRARRNIRKQRKKLREKSTKIETNGKKEDEEMMKVEDVGELEPRGSRLTALAR